MKGLVSNRVATTTKKSTRNQNQPKIKNNQKSKSTKNQNQPKTKINLKSKSRHKRTVGNREPTGPCWLLLAVRESKTFQLLHCTTAAAVVHCSVCSALSHCVVQPDTLLHLSAVCISTQCNWAYFCPAKYGQTHWLGKITSASKNKTHGSRVDAVMQ